MCVCARDATCSKRECCQRSLSSTAAVAVAAASSSSSWTGIACVCFLPIASHKIQIHSALTKRWHTRSTRYFGYYSEYSVLTTPDARTRESVLSLSLSCALFFSLSVSLFFLPHSHFSGVRTLFAQFVRLSLHFALGCVSSGSLLGQARPQKKNTTKKKNTI